MVSNSSKKRLATSQAGPTLKKVHLETGSGAKGKKRSRPVTATVPNDSETDEGEFEDDLEALGDIGINPDVDDGVVVTTHQQKDVKGSRESHRAQRALLNDRKAAKPHSSLLLDAKRLWSLARQKNIPKNERRKHILNLMAIVRGNVQEIVFKHDASRIIQTIVKHGGQQERDEIAAELKGRYRDLAQSKYSKFLITKLIRHCPTHRLPILLEFDTHVVRLLLHREASSVIADAYELYANAYERSLLLWNFYGKEVTLFSPSAAKGAADNDEKTEIKKGLKGVLTDVDQERRKRILVAVKENLDLIFNNSEKGAIAYAIVHHALWEYITELNGLVDEILKEKLRRDIFESCQEGLAEMVHTKDGSRVVREFLAQGTAKDRKQIVKILKPHIERICKDDEAQLVLFTALDVIDDTKLTCKSLVAEIVSRASDLYSSSQGRRSLLYLLVPRSSRHFTPAQTALLAETDLIKAVTSKKDDAVRREEIRNAASDGLIKLLTEEGKAEKMLRDPGGSLVVCEIMLFAHGDKSRAIEALLTPMTAVYPSSDEAEQHIIDIPHTSRVYKTLLQGGHYSQQTKAVIRMPTFLPSAFASAWMEIVRKDNTLSIAQGNGAFIVASLCERVRDEGTEQEKSDLRDWFGMRLKIHLKDSQIKGRDVLLESLCALDPLT